MTRFKICCIRNEDELVTAFMCGASAVGLVSTMPSGPGPISDEEIARLLPRVPPGISAFLLTSLTDPDALIAQWRRLPADTLQLVDRLPTGAYERLRSALPGVRLVQVLHVEGPDAVEEAHAVASKATTWPPRSRRSVRSVWTSALACAPMDGWTP